MASTHFYYSPTTGTGNATITTSAETTNTQTHGDLSATITITNGVTTATVGLRHKFKPYKTQGPTSIPATGGSIFVYVYSEYDIVFRSVPLWITIKSGNTTYTEGQRIPVSTLGSEARFDLVAEPNTGAQRTIQYEGMNIAHYIGDTLNTVNCPVIEGTQAANEGLITDLNEVVFDWNETAAKVFHLSASTNWTSTIADD